MNKLKATLGSRKFWATVAAIATAITAAYNHAIPWGDAVYAIIAALCVYCTGAALEKPVEGEKK